MRTCPDCERVMDVDVSTGQVVHTCATCGKRVDGADEDARIFGDVLDAGETEAMFRRLIRSAAFDRVNEQVAKDCPECGLDYLTQIRVGARQVVVFVCKCGYDSSRASAGGGAQAASARTGR
jgi:predicted RNA-binding Zn-ribbon protein involved in translation (DUF1610 family)